MKHNHWSRWIGHLPATTHHATSYQWATQSVLVLLSTPCKTLNLLTYRFLVVMSEIHLILSQSSYSEQGSDANSKGEGLPEGTHTRSYDDEGGGAGGQ